MKLESKLGISTGILVLAMFLSAFIAGRRIEEANALSASVTHGRLPVISAVRDVRSDVMLSVRALESNLLFGTDSSSSQDFRKERLDSLAAADAPLAVLVDRAQHFDLGADAGRIEEMRSRLDRVRTLEEEIERLNELHTSAGASQAYDHLRNQLIPMDHDLFAFLEQFTRSQEDQSNTEMARLSSANKSVLVTLWSATVFGAVLGTILSTVLARRITGAIDLVAGRADAIASGDLMGDDLPIDSTDQVGALADAMKRMQEGLRSIIGTVAGTAGDLTSSAAAMRTSSDHIHNRIDQQTQQTQQAATAMQEMSASIAEVSRHTQSAAETARAAAKTAHEGGDIVQQMLESMHSIAAAVSETSATVGVLGEDSHRISQIVTVIDEIARKTNLLALNAAIEAARAGEQGRGFAVVAGEVRHLAESTAKATSEISAMIKGIQDRTRTAIASMASGNVTVEQGVVTTRRAGESLEHIIGMAERVDRMITQIAIAASQQAAAADQSSSSLDAIHTLSHENLAEMATTTIGIDSLRATAAALGHQVERFHLAAPSGSPSNRKVPAVRAMRDALTA